MSNLEHILLKLLKETFTEDKYKTDDIYIKELSTAGANYSSVIYKIIVKSLCDGDDLQLFAKVAAWPAAMRKEMNSDFIYEIEHYFYSTIVTIYEALQEKYNIEPEDKFVVPKFYACNSKCLEETIVLEDLVVKGYELYDRFEPLDWQFTYNAVTQLAKFHALSFVFKNEYPEAYAEVKAKFENAPNYLINAMDMFKNIAIKVAELVPEDMKDRLLAFIEKQISDKMIMKYMGPGKWSAFVHGDYRASNIMYKKNEDGKVTSLIPVDYQTIHFGSPATDFIYLIYNGTDEEFRKQHLDELRDIYYDTLSRWLTTMNLEPEETFSRKDFDEDYKDMLSYGLFVSITCLPIVLVEVDDAPKFDESTNLDSFAVRMGERFLDRFLPTLCGFASLGIL